MTRGHHLPRQLHRLVQHLEESREVHQERRLAETQDHLRAGQAEGHTARSG